MSYEGCDVIDGIYVVCLDVRLCLLGTIITKIIVKKTLFSFDPSGGGVVKCTNSMLSTCPGTPGHSQQENYCVCVVSLQDTGNTFHRDLWKV